MDLETEKFTYYLDECYFHPERDKKFSTETEKQLARKAMETLWNKPNITVNGVTYTNQDIRSKLLYEMMPEIMDRDMECYKDAKSETAYLAGCMFRTLIDYDSYIERLFRQTYRF